MLNKLSHVFLFFVAMLFFFGCEAEKANIVAWGKSNVYDDFLWKKYVPDTLTHKITFDFNDDAKKFGKSIKFGIFKKDENKLVKVLSDELEIFVDGKKVDAIEVSPDTKSLNVGFVFGNESENKTHHWYLKIIDGANFDRINDLTPEEFNEENTTFTEVVLEKNKIWNPVAKILFWVIVLILAILIIWFAFFKEQFNPTFKGGAILFELDEIPYNKKLRGYKKFICTNSNKKQSFLNKIFTGEICYLRRPAELWVSDIEFTPASKRRIRIHCNQKDFYCDSGLLERGNDYKLTVLSNNKIVKLSVQ